MHLFVIEFYTATAEWQQSVTQSSAKPHFLEQLVRQIAARLFAGGKQRDAHVGELHEGDTHGVAAGRVGELERRGNTRAIT